ncbi:hypothetical protein ACX3YG_10175 [Pseudomonas wadenswilerensis]
MLDQIKEGYSIYGDVKTGIPKILFGRDPGSVLESSLFRSVYEQGVAATASETLKGFVYSSVAPLKAFHDGDSREMGAAIVNLLASRISAEKGTDLFFDGGAENKSVPFYDRVYGIGVSHE